MNDDGLCPECCEYIGNDGWNDCPVCGTILIEPDGDDDQDEDNLGIDFDDEL